MNIKSLKKVCKERYGIVNKATMRMYLTYRISQMELKISQYKGLKIEVDNIND